MAIAVYIGVMIATDVSAQNHIKDEIVAYLSQVSKKMHKNENLNSQKNIWVKLSGICPEFLKPTAAIKIRDTTQNKKQKLKVLLCTQKKMAPPISIP